MTASEGHDFQEDMEDFILISLIMPLMATGTCTMMVCRDVRCDRPQVGSMFGNL